MSDDTIRDGELFTALPDSYDASLYFIGRIRTPWVERKDCPRRGDVNGPVCQIEIDPRWQGALLGIEKHKELQILYWMDLARRDLVVQVPRSNGVAVGTFALRSPVRPNPIASSIVSVFAASKTTLLVRGLDCVDGTPLLDIKPHFSREDD